MINKDKIIFETQTYFTPSYSGPIGVKILELLPNDKVLIKTGKHTFIREVRWMFNKEEHARHSGKEWEHAEKKRKREVQQIKKAAKKRKCIK